MSTAQEYIVKCITARFTLHKLRVLPSIINSTRFEVIIAPCETMAEVRKVIGAGAVAQQLHAVGLSVPREEASSTCPDFQLNEAPRVIYSIRALSWYFYNRSYIHRRIAYGNLHQIVIPGEMDTVPHTTRLQLLHDLPGHVAIFNE